MRYLSIIISLKWYQELKISQLLFIIKLSLKEFFLNCQHFYPFLDTYWKNVYNSFYSQRRAESKLINQAGWMKNKINFQFLESNLNEFYVQNMIRRIYVTLGKLQHFPPSPSTFVLLHHCTACCYDALPHRLFWIVFMVDTFG